jgi:membrane complex biogenesis BtpA family protein
MYDADAGMDALVVAVSRDVEILVGAGFDAILFCNEADRPYELRAGLEAAAAMARVVTECRPAVPYGVDFLWDPACALAVAVATGARFIRGVVSGLWESDMGLWEGRGAALLRERRRLSADDVAVLANISPEFASLSGSRDPASIARSTAVSSIPDAILVSGPMAGAPVDLPTLTAVRSAVPAEVPVLVNTGVRSSTVAELLGVVDGCIVGSDLKVDGSTWNPVDTERARDFVRAARGPVPA